MIESFQNIFKKPLTLPYPSTPIPKTEHYRGLIKYTETECIFCDRCEKACPTKAIVFTQSCEKPGIDLRNNNKAIRGKAYKKKPKKTVLITNRAKKSFMIVLFFSF